MAINITNQKRPVAALLDEQLGDQKLHEVIDSLISFIASLDDDEDDRQGLIKILIMALSNAEIQYRTTAMIELPKITTDETWLLYNDIYRGIEGRFAMWYKDAEAVYNIASIPGNYLEIGTAHGGSAIMASKAKKEGKIYCVDPLESSYSHVLKNFEKFGVDGVTLIRKMTPPLPEELDGLEFSAVLIDATIPGSSRRTIGCP